LTNHDFLEALRHLAFTRQDKVLRPVDYKNLGAEELGGVYESLLALTPQISADGARFTFAEFAGNERKTSGSYYTPDSLVQCLLDSALDPVVEEAIKGKAGDEAEKAILALKVCDPAVGSGHFLIGTAHRLARHLARVRAQAQGESEPSPLLYQHALRDAIGRCLYGVDINPMAAELCRVGLWLEALEPGKPLSFLDHHIRVGNSLLGTTPELIARGLPDEAFAAIAGDDKKACAVLKKRNKAERRPLGPLFAQQDAEAQARLEQAAAGLEELPDDRPLTAQLPPPETWQLSGSWCSGGGGSERGPHV
jgi:type I restriction-modification system DNA methylase subunit